MGLLADHQIVERAIGDNMIVPFVDKQVSTDEDGHKILSYGLSSYGYDVRCANQFKVFTDINSGVVDPKNFDDKNLVNIEADSILIPPHSFVLTHSIERIKVPRDILIVCIGKSTLARCGVVVGITPLEPEWEGHVTIELSNTTSLPVRIYANEGVAQFLFYMGDEMCDTSYADRKGKYMHQEGIVVPRI